jgi:hypothetical protein
MPNITQWAVALATLLLIAVGFAFVGTQADVPSTSQQTSAVKCNPQMPQFRGAGRGIHC